MKKLAVIVMALFILCCGSVYAAARMSGKILSVNPSSGIYKIELRDKKVVTVKLQEGGKILKGTGGGSFAVGETVVMTIISPLNEEVLVADSIMDSHYAQNTAPSTAYTIPKSTRTGGFATIAGPAATGGQSPNVVGGIAQGGGNLTPPHIVDAPFTASPVVANTPFTGQAITAPDGSTMPNLQHPMSNLPDIPGKTNPTGQPLTMGNTPASAAPNMDHSMTQGNPYSQTPQSMIYQDSALAPSDAATSLFGTHDDEETEEADPFAQSNMTAGSPGTPIQITAKVMNIDLSNGIIFYMLPGGAATRELGTAVINAQTQIVDGRTNQRLQAGNLSAGATVVINGVRRDATSIHANSVVIMP